MGKVVAFDQSTVSVGWVCMSNGVFETGGVFHPKEKPNYDDLRAFVRSIVSPGDVVVVESIYFGINPNTALELVRVQSHIWATARDLGCLVEEIRPYASMRSLTGITSVKTKSKERKAAMVKYATLLLGEPVSEHFADALGLAWAYLKLSPVLDPETAVGLF